MRRSGGGLVKVEVVELGLIRIHSREVVACTQHLNTA